MKLNKHLIGDEVYYTAMDNENYLHIKITEYENDGEYGYHLYVNDELGCIFEKIFSNVPLRKVKEFIDAKEYLLSRLELNIKDTEYRLEDMQKTINDTMEGLKNLVISGNQDYIIEKLPVFAENLTLLKNNFNTEMEFLKRLREIEKES